MTISLLWAFVFLAPQDAVRPAIERQEQQIRQLHSELQQQNQQLKRMEDLLARQDQKTICAAEMRWVSGGEPRKTPGGPLSVVSASLFSIVSKPAGTCLPSEIRVTASYVDAEGNLVCSGVIENMAIQSSLTQSVNLDIRPWNLREFARWRNEPPQVNSGPKRLICMNPEGTAEAASDDLLRVASVRVRATALPANGGMSTVETQLTLQR